MIREVIDALAAALAAAAVGAVGALRNWVSTCLDVMAAGWGEGLSDWC